MAPTSVFVQASGSTQPRGGSITARTGPPANVRPLAGGHAAALKCRSGVCQQQKDGFSQQTDPLIVHNAYSGGCTDDPLYGATCKCNPGFANRGGVNSTTCEDIKECEAGKCPDDGTYTGECREMIGTHECVCHDPQGKHPDTGGFNATTRENTEKDWSKCERESTVVGRRSRDPV
ncbi:MAG: uncharacterized protein KVP18_003434 [Porospora cf. gigantea A]|uniref:uncharacterized protein n=1 Tax=Porospora cf. gigantea A TaxID=2853593 RepID=UPI0035593BB5|nr:MAG: hypothetical protein KVP18_003434 [Porospora cf. gigantea A]